LHRSAQPMEGLLMKLSPRPSMFFRAASYVPGSYRLVPEKLRAMYLRYLLRGKLARARGLNFLRHIEGTPLREPVGPHEATCIMTHDIETRRGLVRALRLKLVEEKKDISSIWFVPSREFRLDRRILGRLAEGAEVGSHDLRHDGRIMFLSESRLVERFRESKSHIESLIEKPVRWFRAPLLQHHARMFRALARAGYEYDSSVPTWEPAHPVVGGPYWTGLIGPIEVSGILEVPLTLPQDHQMMHVLGLSPRETVKIWLRMASKLTELGGIITVLVHPDYEFADREGLKWYRRLVREIADIGEFTITPPGARS